MVPRFAFGKTLAIRRLTGNRPSRSLSIRMDSVCLALDIGAAPHAPAVPSISLRLYEQVFLSRLLKCNDNSLYLRLVYDSLPKCLGWSRERDLVRESRERLIVTAIRQKALR